MAATRSSAVMISTSGTTTASAAITSCFEATVSFLRYEGNIQDSALRRVRIATSRTAPIARRRTIVSTQHYTHYLPQTLAKATEQAKNVPSVVMQRLGLAEVGPIHAEGSGSGSAYVDRQSIVADALSGLRRYGKVLRAIAGVKCVIPGGSDSRGLDSSAKSQRSRAKLFDAELRFLAGHRQRHFRAAVLLGREPGAGASTPGCRCCVVMFPAPSHPQPERPRVFCPRLPAGGLPDSIVGRLRSLAGTDEASRASVSDEAWATLVRDEDEDEESPLAAAEAGARVEATQRTALPRCLWLECVDVYTAGQAVRLLLLGSDDIPSESEWGGGGDPQFEATVVRRHQRVAEGVGDRDVEMHGSAVGIQTDASKTTTGTLAPALLAPTPAAAATGASDPPAPALASASDPPAPASALASKDGRAPHGNDIASTDHDANRVEISSSSSVRLARSSAQPGRVGDLHPSVSRSDSRSDDHSPGPHQDPLHALVSVHSSVQPPLLPPTRATARGRDESRLERLATDTGTLAPAPILPVSSSRLTEGGRRHSESKSQEGRAETGIHPGIEGSKGQDPRGADRASSKGEEREDTSPPPTTAPQVMEEVFLSPACRAKSSAVAYGQYALAQRQGVQDGSSHWDHEKAQRPHWHQQAVSLVGVERRANAVHTPASNPPVQIVESARLNLLESQPATLATPGDDQQRDAGASRHALAFESRLAFESTRQMRQPVSPEVQQALRDGHEQLSRLQHVHDIDAGTRRRALGSMALDLLKHQDGISAPSVGARAVLGHTAGAAGLHVRDHRSRKISHSARGERPHASSSEGWREEALQLLRDADVALGRTSNSPLAASNNGFKILDSTLDDGAGQNTGLTDATQGTMHANQSQEPTSNNLNARTVEEGEVSRHTDASMEPRQQRNKYAIRARNLAGVSTEVSDVTSRVEETSQTDLGHGHGSATTPRKGDMVVSLESSEEQERKQQLVLARLRRRERARNDKQEEAKGRSTPRTGPSRHGQRDPVHILSQRPRAFVTSPADGGSSREIHLPAAPMPGIETDEEDASRLPQAPSETGRLNRPAASVVVVHAGGDQPPPAQVGKWSARRAQSRTRQRQDAQGARSILIAALRECEMRLATVQHSRGARAGAGVSVPPRLRAGSSASNARRVMTALRCVCMSGPKGKEELVLAQAAIRAADEAAGEASASLQEAGQDHLQPLSFVVLTQSPESRRFRALYAVEHRLNVSHRVLGKGPVSLDVPHRLRAAYGGGAGGDPAGDVEAAEAWFATFWKFDTSTRGLRPLPRGTHLSPSVDAVALHAGAARSFGLTSGRLLGSTPSRSRGRTGTGTGAGGSTTRTRTGGVHGWTGTGGGRSSSVGREAFEAFARGEREQPETNRRPRSRARQEQEPESFIGRPKVFQGQPQFRSRSTLGHGDRSGMGRGGWLLAEEEADGLIQQDKQDEQGSVGDFEDSLRRFLDANDER